VRCLLIWPVWWPCVLESVLLQLKTFLSCSLY
jgi:hypothetical protein